MSITAEVAEILRLDDVEELRDIVEALDTTGNALHKACYQNSIECVKFLIDEGFDVNAEDDHGLSPITWACWGKSREAVRLLLEAGAEPISIKKAGSYFGLLSDDIKQLLAKHTRI